jgi:UrcA family protein
MFKINLLSATLAALTLSTVCASAHAQDVRIAVSDLSQPAQHAAFDRDVAKAVAHFCGDRLEHVGSLADRSSYEGCAGAVRAEAMDQLSSVQREQYAAGSVGALRLASSGK